MTSACSKKTPAGQVAAVVNGKEVTLQELNTEIQAANIPPSADKQTVQRALLQRLIDRKLLVGAAEDKKLDKTPEYLAQKRRTDELLLAQAYAKQQLAAVPVPTQADIDKFMADHANAFSDRQQLVLDQIRFPTPPNLKILSALNDVHSMDAVAATLTKLGIKFDRGQAMADSAQVPPKMMQSINALPPTEPFVIPQPGMITVNVITARKPVPVDQAQARPAAVAAWRQEKFADLLDKQIAALKAGAKIEYQNGFGPPAQPTEAGKNAAEDIKSTGEIKPVVPAGNSTAP